jgi:hypothetical protein
MARSNFENLKVYQMSEDLADKVWDVVLQWDRFARDTVLAQMVRAADSIGRISRKVPDVAVIKTIGGSSG